MTIIAQQIERELSQISPIYLEIINESHQHNVPVGSETHFKLIVVSLAFNGISLIQRHQQIYSILRKQMSMPGGIHALSLYTFTPTEWQTRQQVPATPKCKGGFNQ